MRFRAIEAEDKERATVRLFNRLIQHKGNVAPDALGYANSATIIASDERATTDRNAAVPRRALPRASVALALPWITGLLIEDDAVTGDVDEEGQTAGKLVVDVRQAVGDHVGAGLQLVLDGEFLHEPLVDLEPDFIFLGS